MVTLDLTAGSHHIDSELPMKIPRIVLFLAAVVIGLGVGGGCRARKKEITELQRKEAALQASEAQFSLTLRNWAEAETALAKAVTLDPDNGSYWVTLGSMRMKLGKKDLARDAYKGALRAYELEASKEKTDASPSLQQVYVLALLGRVDDARALLDKTAKRFGDQRIVRVFIEEKQLDRLMADPKFKESAL